MFLFDLGLVAVINSSSEVVFREAVLFEVVFRDLRDFSTAVGSVRLFVVVGFLFVGFDADLAAGAEADVDAGQVSFLAHCIT